MSMKITEALANNIYDILIQECNATPEFRKDFVRCQVEDNPTEYNFGGAICGAKFRNNGNGVYVDGYQECYTSKTQGMIDKANARILKLVSETEKEEIRTLKFFLRRCAVALNNVSVYAPDPQAIQEVASEAFKVLGIEG